MANPKSNIYPVQLQNAELNLNKYDAEIKQYSGFNKNNAPFVGGCLSNLFSKDETIEGSNSSNTYIAPNGDVYKVDRTGLFKNDKKLLSFLAIYNYKFYQRRKLNFDHVGIIKAYNEKNVLYQIDNIIYINDKQVLSVENYLLNYSSMEELVKYNIKGVFQKINNINYFFLFVAKQVVTAGGNCFVFNADTGEFIDNKYVTSTQVGTKAGTLFPITVLTTTGSNEFWVYYQGYRNFYGDYVVRVKWSFNNNTLSYSNVANYQLREDEFQLNILDAESYPEATVFSKNPLDYIFDCDNNKIYAKVVTDIAEADKDIYYSFDLLRDATDPLKVYYAHAEEIGTSPSINGALYTQALQDSLDSKDDIISYVLQYETSNNKINYRPINCGILLTLETKNINGQEITIGNSYLGAFISKGNFKLLINNNNFSGLALSSGVLVTDWNTVDYNSLSFIDEDTVIYKDGDNFYCIEPGEPSLFEINDQIVCNINRSINGVFKNNDQSVCFAISYNNALDAFVINDNYLYFFKTDINNLYIASAVNEYNLKDNASIIINPISVYQSAFMDILCRVQQSVTVNCYTGIDTNIKYYKSFSCLTGYSYFTSFFKKDLIDLPFPIDTNGNVQYSPSLFSEIKNIYGNEMFIKSGNTYYPLMKENNQPVMSFYLASGIDGLDEGFIIQGQFYGILDNNIYSLSYNNGVLSNVSFVVSVEGLKFCGNTPYEALFYSETNRCLYSFTGANVLNVKQIVDKISGVKRYKYNPSTQSIILITDIGVIISGLFGIYLIDMTECEEVFLLNNGIVLTDNLGNYRYIKYYIKTEDTDYTKDNIEIETCFYGMNDQTVTVNDCLYMRLYSEEHESGDVVISATTMSLEGRSTETTTYRVKSSDWDEKTHTYYLRYQPQTQRGVGISFSINSPFKIASMSIGSQPDAILIDNASKTAVTKSSKLDF